MRVLILADCETPLYAMDAGTVIDLPDDIAAALVNEGTARQARGDAPAHKEAPAPAPRRRK